MAIWDSDASFSLSNVLGDQPTVEVEGFPAGTFPSSRCTVEIVEGPDQGASFSFEKAHIRVGSDILSDVALSDPTVSRRHAELLREESGFRLIDLNSTNGTFIGDLRLGEIFIEERAVIKFGQSVAIFTGHVEGRTITPAPQDRFGEIVGRSLGLRQIFAILDKVSPTHLTIIIDGETGTGKELFARAIHEGSRRAKNPFVIFDCSAFPATLLESELFGHERGAFSGASNQHRGVFERAHEGTLFLDELGEMDVDLQPKLLRALESGEFRRVGGERTVQVDVRVVAATNRNLEDMIANNTFRRDLFYRLAQVRFRLPPLRARLDDIPLLIDAFLDQLHAAGNFPIKPYATVDALKVMQDYTWPGNVRELRNLAERAATLCDGGRITAAFVRNELDLSNTSLSHATSGNSPQASAFSFENEDGTLLPLREAKNAVIAELEQRYLQRLLQKHQQNVSAAAREAQIDRRHFYRLLKKYGLERSS